MIMVIGAILSLILGVVCGHWVFNSNISSLFSQMAEPVLFILMFSVGISVGLNRLVFSKLRELHFKILVIPFGVILGSLIGGAVTAVFFGMGINEGMAVASGLGWYSLSGVIMTEIAGAELGTITFMSSLLRESFSFVLIPIVAKYTNQYTAIAPPAATSEDTTLPIIRKYASDEVVVMAVLNGVICSALVPLLVNASYYML